MVSARSKTKRATELFQARAKPYRCMICASIQFESAGHAIPSNCDRLGCESGNIEECGPVQVITFRVFQELRPV
jgi:hypothetical protein